MSSIALVVARGHSAGRVRGRSMDDQEVCFLYATQEPPHACVSWAGIRASGKRSGGDGRRVVVCAVVSITEDVL